MGKEKTLPILALIVLIIGSISSVYVYATTTNSTTILISSTEYTLDQLFILGKQKIININDEIFSGVALDDIIMKIGVSSPEKHAYTLIGSDGYQKTVQWENLKNGVLTHDQTVVFSDLPKAYRMKNIAGIEVS